MQCHVLATGADVLLNIKIKWRQEVTLIAKGRVAVHEPVTRVELVCLITALEGVK